MQNKNVIIFQVQTASTLPEFGFHDFGPSALHGPVHLPQEVRLLWRCRRNSRQSVSIKKCLEQDMMAPIWSPNNLRLLCRSRFKPCLRSDYFLLLVQDDMLELGRGGGGQVVSVLAFYADDPNSESRLSLQFFSVKFVFKKNENKQKEADLVHLKKTECWRPVCCWPRWGSIGRTDQNKKTLSGCWKRLIM